MNISRKDFFKKSIFSLGEAVFSVKDALNGPVVEEHPNQQEGEFTPNTGEDRLAVARNEHCLARNCGCFACVDRCEPQAIMVVMGEGIRVDESRCTGCGTCEHVCPVTPKAVRMEPRKKESDPASLDADAISKKGE